MTHRDDVPEDIARQLQPLVEDDAYLSDLSQGVDPSGGADPLAGLLLELRNDVNAQMPPAPQVADTSAAATSASAATSSGMWIKGALGAAAVVLGGVGAFALLNGGGEETDPVPAPAVVDTDTGTSSAAQAPTSSAAKSSTSVSPRAEESVAEEVTSEASEESTENVQEEVVTPESGEPTPRNEVNPPVPMSSQTPADTPTSTQVNRPAPAPTKNSPRPGTTTTRTPWNERDDDREYTIPPLPGETPREPSGVPTPGDGDQDQDEDEDTGKDKDNNAETGKGQEGKDNGQRGD